MEPMRVLRFPRSDEETTSVVVRVSSAGNKPLDLKLVATEGYAPYVCVLKHDRIASLRVKNCPVSETEWEHILSALLRQEAVDDIQVAAAVQSNSSISLTVRKQVQGITQRLGAISLKCDQAEEIELFQWCNLSLDALDSFRKDATQSITRVQALESELSSLKTQLDELVQAKQDDEAALLLKFRDLLNEKKVKIREQQKLIAASSPAGNDAASSDQQPGSQPTSQDAAPPRGRKRKAPPRKADDGPQGDVDEAMEDVVSEPGLENTDPGNTTDGTASMADDSERDGPAESEMIRDGDSSGPARQGSSEKERVPAARKTGQDPPPRRDLPFANKRTAAPSAAEDTESDDEL
ncbi:hypothetical protein HIM_00222 [Hirsutella minnesotensis 3608]|nr:hypothetical protein HIM_00222 [Hirsutella minnesotensis 3608]